MTFAAASLVWDPVFPVPIIVLLWLGMAGLAVWTTWRHGPRLSGIRRTILTALRLLGVAFLLLPLLRPSREKSIPRMHPERLALVAVDTSRSMNENDVNGATRLDATRQIIRQHQLLDRSPIGVCRLHAFDVESRMVGSNALDALRPDGESTRFDDSLGSILRSLTGREKSVGLFVFTDGHDFQGAPPERLTRLARQNQTPIFPVPIGRTVHLPDIAVSIISSQPTTFVRQKTRVEAAISFRSISARQIRVELLRAGQVVREQKITVANDGEIPVGFDVSEEESGQYEYGFRCLVQPDERDGTNNAAYTYLNVTDARVPILLLEGEPHWDTSFLQRTLARNDRMRIDAACMVGKSRMQSSRSDPSLPPLEKISPEMLAEYPVIILGRSVERLLSNECIAAIAKSVSDAGLTLIYARGRPGMSSTWQDLSPAPLGDGFSGPVNVDAAAAAGNVVPLEVLSGPGADKLPPLPAASALGKPKTLASVEARAHDVSQKNALPAMMLRQQGSGQVFAVALEGLWRWSLHADATADNNVYERFWNQLLLNLIARSNRTPSDKAQLIVSRANVQLGEQITFQISLPKAGQGSSIEFAQPPQLHIFRDDIETGTVQMQQEGKASPWRGTMAAEQIGKFRAEATLPNGETVKCRFGVFEFKKETTDVATDLEYLKKLASGSGGKVVDAASLPVVLESLARAAAAESAAPPIIRRTSLWDVPQFFWLLCGTFGVDWFLRRRWGLV